MSDPKAIPVDPGAFDFAADEAVGAPGGESRVALCLHGLTGTPYEVRAIGETLASRGVRAVGPMLPGHGRDPEFLEASTHEEWLRAAREAFDGLRKEYDRVFLVGVSMGGLLSLRLAQTQPVDGLVVIGTPLVLSPPIPQLLPFVRAFWRFRKKSGSDIRDAAARERHPKFEAMPLASVANLIALQARVIPNLTAVRAPILVAHGRLDRTARPRDAQRIHDEVGSSEKELFYLDRSGHIATVDHDGAALIRAAADFLGRC